MNGNLEVLENHVIINNFASLVFNNQALLVYHCPLTSPFLMHGIHNTVVNHNVDLDGH
jgi:hypothetical protein